MKAEPCQAIAANGKPCAATPRPGRPYCLWHDPEAVETRRELSRKGGQGRSNAARLRKALPVETLTLGDVQGVLGKVLKDCTGGQIEPGVANAAANVARAIAAVAQAGELEARVERLEAAGDGRQAGRMR